MADISASMVMELRQRTGLGMMECKKALTEVGGDLAKAEELLRIRSGAKASKAAGRIAAEGIVGAYLAADGEVGGDGRGQLRDRLRRAQRGLRRASRSASRSSIAEKNPADVAALSALPLDGGTVESARAGAGAEDRREPRDPPLRALRDAGRLVQYLHGGGRIGVTVELDGGDEATGKDIAMHVAASAAPGAVRPVCVSRDQVPADLIAKEREIYAAQAADSGKPAEIVAKMVEGRIDKYLAEVTLLGQPFVKNPDETVEKYLKAKGATVKALRAVRRRRGHREEEGRLRRRGGGDGQGVDAAAVPARCHRARRSPTSRSRAMNPSTASPFRRPGRRRRQPRAAPAYRRILLKLSGEALMGDDPYGINREVIDRIVAEIAEVVAARRRDRRSSSAAATSSAASRPARRAWTAPPPTTWACWRR